MPKRIHHSREDVEENYRRNLAGKKPPIKSDKAIIAWLEGLGTAISAWEREWLERLKEAQ
jgi:hypothetical protein